MTVCAETFDYKNQDSSWVARIHGEDVTNHASLVGILRNIKTASEAVKLITNVFGTALCSGNIGFDDLAQGK